MTKFLSFLFGLLFTFGAVVFFKSGDLIYAGVCAVLAIILYAGALAF